jgi:hypothetical protein
MHTITTPALPPVVRTPEQRAREVDPLFAPTVTVASGGRVILEHGTFLPTHIDEGYWVATRSVGINIHMDKAPVMAERIRSLDKSPWFSGESFIGIRSVAWGDVEYPVAYIIESMAYFRDYGSAYTYALQTGGGLFDARYQNIMRCAHVEVM